MKLHITVHYLVTHLMIHLFIYFINFALITNSDVYGHITMMCMVTS